MDECVYMKQPVQVEAESYGMDIVKEELNSSGTTDGGSAIKMEPEVELTVPDESETVLETQWYYNQLFEGTDRFHTLIPRPGSAVGERSDCDDIDDSESGDDSDDGDGSSQRKIPEEKKLPQKWNWTDKGKFAKAVDIPDNDLPCVSPAIDDGVLSPVNFFELFFDESVFDLILEQTNIYLKTKYKREGDFSISKREMLDFIRIELFMGFLQMPSYTDYWSDLLSYEPIADTMTMERYEFIRRHLHFVDNSHADLSDRYCKIRDLFDRIRRNFLKTPNTRRQSIEQIVLPYCTVHATDRELYLPFKPPKEGFKIFARCGSDGFIYDMLFHNDDETFKSVDLDSAEDGLDFGAKVVLSLCKTLPDPKSFYNLVYDDWASSLPLMTYLKNHLGIHSLALIKESALGQIDFPSNHLLKKMGKGSMAHKFDNENGVAATKWYEGSIVVMATTYVRQETCHEKIPCPRAIKEYQKCSSIDGEELFEGPNRPDYYRCHKYYLTVFRLLLNICVRNAWILYKRHVVAENQKRRASGLVEKPLKIKKLPRFRADVAKNLAYGKIAQSAHTRIPAPDDPSFALRFDTICHYPNFGEEGRCAYCRSFTLSFCTKCEVPLCVTLGRNCFKDYHTNKGDH